MKSLVFCKASHSAAVSKSLAERTDRSDRINLPTCLCKVQPGSTGSTRINQVQNNLDPAQQVARPLLAVLSLALLRCSIWTWDFCDNCRDCDKKNLTRKTFIFSLETHDSHGFFPTEFHGYLEFDLLAVDFHTC